MSWDPWDPRDWYYWWFGSHSNRGTPKQKNNHFHKGNVRNPNHRAPKQKALPLFSRPQSRLSSFPAARGLIIERVRRKHKREQSREGPGVFRDLRYVQLIPWWSGFISSWICKLILVYFSMFQMKFSMSRKKTVIISQVWENEKSTQKCPSVAKVFRLVPRRV